MWTMHPDATDAAEIVQRVRAITVELNLLGSTFAAGNDLHVTDLRAIIELLDAEHGGTPATPSFLAERLHLNSASVTALIDRLEGGGLVARTRDAVDRRRVRITVMPGAKQVGLAFCGPLVGRMLAILDTFTDTEAATINRFLGLIADDLVAQTG
jgi:DNA-binding MarR family transcriptional regulator